ncbi:MAG TPA: flagellar biosynthesis anti-sigma factor FlgM [Gammaproteobacteria bacterium]|nr:flagellar biosynthesis anti-sigma factor FlgM [Gammaproteobacteria bacterium]
MSIDINGISSPKVPSTGDDSQLKQSAEKQTGSAENTRSSTADTVSLSDNAVQLGKLDNSSIPAPVVDTQRVQQIKQAIENGTYEVDPKKIADKLMQFESILKSGK